MMARQADAHQMLRVPAEQLAQSCRKQHKLVEKELNSAMGEIHEVLKDSHAAPSSMNGLVDRLHGLKRKVEDDQVQEDELLQRCRMRLDYLQKMQERDANPKNRDSAQTERLQRLVADYLLREGYDNSARCLAEGAGLERYLDFELVLASRDVLAALQARDCEPALAWCAEHRAKLKKAGSTLELQLRLQQFVELVRSGRAVEALSHARRHLSSAAEFEPQLRLAMTSLALGPATCAAPYAKLFDEAAWGRLAALFHKQQLAALAMPATAPLLVAIGAGLTALKTPACFHGDHACRECPVCNEPFQALAEQMPGAQRSQSSLVCRLSGLPMNEDNPPLVLPSGNVYSRDALLSIAADGVLRDPQTQEVVHVDQLRKAFFM
jgi:macrophage erythroblast attacher